MSSTKIKSFAQAFEKACMSRAAPLSQFADGMLYKRRMVEKHFSGMFFVRNPCRRFAES